jgi:hypothetical protein
MAKRATAPACVRGRRGDCRAERELRPCTAGKGGAREVKTGEEEGAEEGGGEGEEDEEDDDEDEDGGFARKENPPPSDEAERRLGEAETGPSAAS